MTGEVRDEVLGTALRELDVPEHRPGFRAAVEARLREGAVARVPSPPAGRHRRRPRQPVLRPGPWTWGLSAAAVIALAVLVVTSTLPGTRPPIATAAEVRQAVARAWAQADSVSGVLVWRGGEVFDGGTRRWSFILTAGGDFRLDDLTRDGSVVYDAQRGVERNLGPSESIPDSGVLFASERGGLPPGPPDQGPFSYTFLQRGLGSVVRALASGGGGTVSETTYEGRPGWLLDTDIRVNLIVPEQSPNHLRVTVDQQTGLPVRVIATHDDRFVWESRIEDAKVNEPLPKDAFRLDFPPGAEVFRDDLGFRRVSLDEIEGIVGYDPLVPSWLPEGYGVAEITASRKGLPTGAEAGNPPVGDVASLVYRRGLDQFIVTTRPVGPDPSLWGDPLASGEGLRDEPERVRLEGGALAGETGQLLIDPLAIPHVWVMTDRLVVTVSGDLTRDELLRVAESLR